MFGHRETLVCLETDEWTTRKASSHKQNLPQQIPPGQMQTLENGHYTDDNGVVGRIETQNFTSVLHSVHQVILSRRLQTRLSPPVHQGQSFPLEDLV